MMNIKILVAAHKSYWMPDDDVYFPIQVGAAGKKSLGWQRDDEGENISVKNSEYCELTALYWAWKNLDADYIGLCHYRRYFVHRSLLARLKPMKYRIFHREDYERLLLKHSLIIPTKGKIKVNHNVVTLAEQYCQLHQKVIWENARDIIIKNHPEYTKSLLMVEQLTHMHYCNMFVMSKEQFSGYCAWLFSILFELERRIVEGRNKENKEVSLNRELGFLAERLFNVWLKNQKNKIYEAPIKKIEETDLSWGREKLYKITKPLYE